LLLKFIPVGPMINFHEFMITTLLCMTKPTWKRN